MTQAGLHASPEKLLAVTPLIRERIKLLKDAVSAADFFFLDQLRPYDPAELIPQISKKESGDAALARRVLQTALEVLPATPFDHDSLDKTFCAKQPLRSDSKPAPCSSRYESPSAAAKTRRPSSKP